MSVPIEIDQRYRVNQRIVDQMRKLFAEGVSCSKIAKKFSVSHHTAYYWTHDEYRKFKQGKNAERRHEKKKHSRDQTERRTRQWLEYDIAYIIDAVTNAKNEKRCKRKTVLGKTIEEWDKILKEYKTGSQKVR